MDFRLVFERNHEELVALLEADYSVGEEPDAVEDGVAAEQPSSGQSTTYPLPVVASIRYQHSDFHAL